MQLVICGLLFCSQLGQPRGKCLRHFLSKHRALTAHWFVGVTPNPYYRLKGGSMARRNIKIDLRLSEPEMERLRRDVARSGWSREKYLRALIDKSVIREMPSMDLVAIFSRSITTSIRSPWSPTPKALSIRRPTGKTQIG